MPDYPIQPELTAIAVNVKPRGLIADQVMPRTAPLNKESFKYQVYDTKDALTSSNDVVNPRSQVPAVEFHGVEMTASTKDYGLRDVIPSNEENQRIVDGAIRPSQISTERLAQKVLLNRELRVAEMVKDENNHGAKEVLTATTKWSASASDPIAQIVEKRDGMLGANVLVLGSDVWTKLRTNTKLLKSIYPNGSGEGVANLDQVRDVLELDAIVVGRALVNTAKIGKAASLSQAWTGVAALIYQDQIEARARGTVWGFTGQYGQDMVVYQREVSPGQAGIHGGIEITVGNSLKEVVAAKSLGFLWQQVI